MEQCQTRFKTVCCLFLVHGLLCNFLTQICISLSMEISAPIFAPWFWKNLQLPRIGWNSDNIYFWSINKSQYFCAGSYVFHRLKSVEFEPPFWLPCDFFGPWQCMLAGISAILHHQPRHGLLSVFFRLCTLQTALTLAIVARACVTYSPFNRNFIASWVSPVFLPTKQIFLWFKLTAKTSSSDCTMSLVALVAVIFTWMPEDKTGAVGEPIHFDIRTKIGHAISAGNKPQQTWDRREIWALGKAHSSTQPCSFLSCVTHSTPLFHSVIRVQLWLQGELNFGRDRSKNKGEGKSLAYNRMIAVLRL